MNICHVCEDDSELVQRCRHCGGTGVEPYGEPAEEPPAHDDEDAPHDLEPTVSYPIE